MKILVDMDGIAVDLLPVWLREYNASYGDNLRVDQITQWETHKFVKPECGKHVYTILNRPGFFDYLPPIPGAVEAIKTLAQVHDVRFATHPPGADAARGKIEWIKRHFGWNQDHVFLCKDKSWIGADWLIDDCPYTIEKWANAGRNIATIYHPYNASAVDKATFVAEPLPSYAQAWEALLDRLL